MQLSGADSFKTPQNIEEVCDIMILLYRLSVFCDKH